MHGELWEVFDAGDGPPLAAVTRASWLAKGDLHREDATPVTSTNSFNGTDNGHDKIAEQRKLDISDERFVFTSFAVKQEEKEHLLCVQRRMVR